MRKPVTENPDALAAIVTGLGGQVVPGSHFQFDLLQEDVREVIPRLNDLGLRCERISEWVTDHPRQINRNCTVVRIGLYKEKS